MADIKNYVSNYSGDQLDAAIAVLGSLKTMFFSQSEFNKFKEQFSGKMQTLSNEVTEVLNKQMIWEQLPEDQNK